MRACSNLLFLYRELPIDEIMDRLEPDVVVIEEYFLEAHSGDPRATGNPEARRSFQALAGYLSQHCSRNVARIEDFDYGTIRVYDCRAARRLGRFPTRARPAMATVSNSD